MVTTRKDSGLIKLILIIIVAILVLSYFNFDIRAIVESPQAQENLGYVWGFVKHVWDDYLSRPILYFWNNIFINLLWESFVENLLKIKAGEPGIFEQNAPQVPLAPLPDGEATPQFAF